MGKLKQQISDQPISSEDTLNTCYVADEVNIQEKFRKSFYGVHPSTNSTAKNKWKIQTACKHVSLARNSDDDSMKRMPLFTFHELVL